MNANPNEKKTEEQPKIVQDQNDEEIVEVGTVSETRGGVIGVQPEPGQGVRF